MTSLKSASDSLLIESYLSGNQKAFALIMRRYQSRIYSTALLVVKDKYIAEDILQDTFCKFVGALKKGNYSHLDKLGGFLVRVAHNLAIDHVRKVNLLPKITSSEGEDVFRFLNIPEEDPFIRERKQSMLIDLKWAITQLPDDQREVVLMRCFAKMSFNEIAEITGLNINTALGKMRYAVISLKKILAKKKEKYDPNLYPQ